MQPARVEVFDPAGEVGEGEKQVRSVAEGRGDLVIRTSDGVETAVGPLLSRALRTVAASLAEGRAVIVADASATVSPAEASRMLGVSRPLVTRWIAEGLLADSPVGAHHRIPVESVAALLSARQRAGYQAMALLEAAEQEPETSARVDGARARARARIAARRTS